MPRGKLAFGRVKTAIADLLIRRKELVAELAEIDSAFAGAGLDLSTATAAPTATSGRKVGRPKGKRKGKRGSFAQSGAESILGFVKAKGSPVTSEINKHWIGEGRGGRADTTLLNLVKAKKLKRTKAKGQGSEYRIV